MRRCATCPTLIPNKGKQKYCPACAAERKRERDRLSASQRRKVISQHFAALGFKRKRRLCLSCNKSFMSEGPWNRICRRCNEAHAGQTQSPSSRGRWNGNPLLGHPSEEGGAT